MVNCPLCEASIDVDEDELDEGDAISCEDCGATLNVLGLDPLELEAGDEDMDDEEDEEEFLDEEDDKEDDDDEDEDEEEW